MRLVCDGIDGTNMSDMNYTTSGYAPLTGRLVQAILTQGSLSQGRCKGIDVDCRDSKVVACSCEGVQANHSLYPSGGRSQEETGSGGSCWRYYLSGDRGHATDQAIGRCNGRV